jgi:hypothetical protein
MAYDMEPATRRTVLRSGAVATAGIAGFAGMVSADGDNIKGGQGFTFTEPTVETFEIQSEASSSDETFQPGCGDNAELEPYSFFHVVDSFDGDGETDRLYPHPSDKRFSDGGDKFEIHNVCETKTGQDRPAYLITFGPI